MLGASSQSTKRHQGQASTFPCKQTPRQAIEGWGGGLWPSICMPILCSRTLHLPSLVWQKVLGHSCKDHAMGTVLCGHGSSSRLGRWGDIALV